MLFKVCVPIKAAVVILLFGHAQKTDRPNQLQVQTKPETDPIKVMVKATNDLAVEIESIKAAFVVRPLHILCCDTLPDNVFRSSDAKRVHCCAGGGDTHITSIIAAVVDTRTGPGLE